MKWNIVSKSGYGTVTESPQCLPYKSTLESIYSAGGRMYKDGKRMTLNEAIAELPKEYRDK